MVLVSLLSILFGNKLMPRNAQHGLEHPLVADSPPVQLRLHHAPPLAKE